MYLHIGKETVVPCEDIVLILGMDDGHQSRMIKEYLQIAEIEGSLISVPHGEEPKSCIVTTRKTFLSAISAATLLKRMSLCKFNASVE